ncbi:MAG TPA: CDP-alcohol phosphatidyltransferase family protein [Kofleriaceae bacterium]|nr:CDP-alcohol phosphatidyltransferase family protein [Kofleriaceae bacterium]
MSEPVAEKLDRFWTPANLVTLSRLAMAPVLLLLANRGMPRAFVLVLTVSLVTDIVDGKLARWLGQASRWGARLDSWADLATYASVPLCAYWLRPDLVHSEAGTFWAIVAAFAVPITYGFIKYGTLTSYHTRGAVIAAYLIGGATVIVFAGGPTWPLRIAAAVLVAAELEEIAITTVLPRPVTMVRSIGVARRIRRERFADLEE